MRELRRVVAVAWRCAPGRQKALAVTVSAVLVGGIAVAVHGGFHSSQQPVTRAAATVAGPAPVVPTRPAPSVPAAQAAAPTTPAPPSAHSTSAAATSAAPAADQQLETASAPDSAAAQACSTFRTAIEPVVRNAVENDDLAPASALVRAGSNPQSSWSQLMSAATLASMRAPALQQHITQLGQGIQQADPSLSLTGLGSDLDAIDLDCGAAPG